VDRNSLSTENPGSSMPTSFSLYLNPSFRQVVSLKSKQRILEIKICVKTKKKLSSERTNTKEKSHKANDETSIFSK
jgi:hypothetical protein